MIEEWLSDRLFYCEVKGYTSLMRNLTHGTVQGSILGPLLFAIFVSPLEHKIKHIVMFADDNFVPNHDRDKTLLIQKTKETVLLARDWLTENGLRVNESKTEICIFYKKDCQCDDIRIGEHLIPVHKKMRVLGVIFDSKLSWYDHVKNALSKANQVKQGLRLIRKYFSTDEMIRLTTAYFYSKLYFGAKIWLISTLHSSLKKQLWQISSRMLMIVDGKQDGLRSFKSLHQKYKRASPMTWSKYTTAIAMWDLVNNQVPESVLLKTMMNRLYEERRQGLLFTRSNTLKIGFNCLSNRLQVVSGALKTNWQDMKKDQFKLYCKRQFVLSEVY